MSTLEDLLEGGDPRALKGVTQVVDIVLHDPRESEALVRALSHDNPTVRMRAGDAAEKVSRTNARCFAPFKAQLLQAAAATEQPSLRWHFAQLIPRLVLDARERRDSAAIFKRYLDDPSAIVKTCAMQALTDLALADPSLRPGVVPLIEQATRVGTAAMRSRGNRLLEILGQSPGHGSR